MPTSMESHHVSPAEEGTVISCARCYLSVPRASRPGVPMF
ncbi:mCG1048381 [Mus musculus]|nr:mCG1048381 [Mus musculus]